MLPRPRCFMTRAAACELKLRARPHNYSTRGSGGPSCCDDNGGSCGKSSAQDRQHYTSQRRLATTLRWWVVNVAPCGFVGSVGLGKVDPALGDAELAGNRTISPTPRREHVKHHRQLREYGAPACSRKHDASARLQTDRAAVSPKSCAMTTWATAAAVASRLPPRQPADDPRAHVFWCPREIRRQRNNSCLLVKCSGVRCICRCTCRWHPSQCDQPQNNNLCVHVCLCVFCEFPRRGRCSL